MRGPWIAWLGAVALGVFASPTPVQAPAEVPAPPAAPATALKLGVFFWHDSPNDEATYAGIQQGLREGGQAATFVEQRAAADPTKAKACFEALRAARCDLVFAMGTQAALLAKDQLRDLPVVFAAVSNPVASGIVPSWDGSGTNLCGASNWIAPQNVLAVFRLAVPGLKRLGLLRSAESGVVSAAEAAAMRAHLAANPEPHLELHEAIAKDQDGLAAAIAELRAQQVDAIWIPIDLLVYQNLPLVQQALGTSPLPLLTTAAAGVRNGALVGAVVDYPLHGRRAAALALSVLRHGKAPGALPIDRLQGNLVVVNLAAARQHGIELPLSLLAIADELIDPELFRAGR